MAGKYYAFYLYQAVIFNNGRLPRICIDHESVSVKQCDADTRNDVFISFSSNCQLIEVIKPRIAIPKGWLFSTTDFVQIYKRLSAEDAP